MQVLKKQFIWLTIWGIAFAAIEAAVVVYLRKIYFPGNFSFPPLPVDRIFVGVEVMRELATLVIMWAVAALIRDRFTERLAVFMILFGLWDIFYYGFLKILIHWPANLATWDVLFLIPVVWIGPVWAPMLVSIFLIAAGTGGLYFASKGFDFHPPFWLWLCELIAMVFIVISFLIPGSRVTQNIAPEPYPWELLAGALIFGLILFGYYLYQIQQKH